jgi:hypothetical protein
MATAIYEFTWIRYLPNDLHVSHSQPAILYYDNKAALHIAANPAHFPWVDKYSQNWIVISFVRRFNQGLIQTAYIPTTHQLMYIFTKPLGRQQFIHLLCKLGIHDVHTPTWGEC